MRFWVDPWDPAYARADPDGDGGGPAQESSAALDLDVEVPEESWAPVPYPVDLRPPATVLLVDGVRRIDARVWTAEPDGGSYPGLAASYAAGVVRCDLRAGVATLARITVARGLFTTSPTATDLDCGPIRYPVHRITAGDLPELTAAVGGPLAALEAEVSSGGDPADAELLVVDGPLRRGRSSGTIGYLKTHRRRYLPPAPAAVVAALAAGQRSPVFLLGTSWHRHTWYLRLPGGTGAPWSGLVRIECPAELPAQSAVALADLSVVTLPRFAATSYKDPRAPQNLVPIAGLEQRLRSRLGDPRLLHRYLTRAAARRAG